MIKEKSCGMVVFKEENDNLYILIVKHNTGHLGLPKGHVEDGEEEIDTAFRETLEETGIIAEVVGDFREVITYSPIENVMKDVVLFIGRPITYEIVPQLSEIESAEWIEVNDALSKDFHGDLRNVILKAIDYYHDNLQK